MEVRSLPPEPINLGKVNDLIDVSFISKGKCQQNHMNPEFFYPSALTLTEKNLELEESQRAKYCQGLSDNLPCLVRSQCLEYALAMHEQGVWGGTTTNERNRIRKRRLKVKRISA